MQTINSQTHPVSFHEGFTCDSCGIKPICGTRYRCIYCKDYDLCSGCFLCQLASAGSVHFPNHLFLAIENRTKCMHSPTFPLTSEIPALPPEQREFNAEGAVKHPGIICSKCEQELWGCRFKCGQCDDINFCAACFVKKEEQPGLSNTHKPSHMFVLVTVPFQEPTLPPKKLFDIRNELTLMRRAFPTPFDLWPCRCCFSSSSGLMPVGLSKAVPLKGVNVTAKVVEVLAQITIEQTYINNTNEAVESFYMYPLEVKAAVNAFSVEIDGRIIRSKVKEKNEQYNETDKLTADQDEDDTLLNIFRCAVGTLPPGKEVKIEITYITELAIDTAGEELALVFSLPTAVGPLYNPLAHKSSQNKPQMTYFEVLEDEGHWLGLPDTEVQNRSLPPPTLRIEVDVESMTIIPNIESVSGHHVQQSFSSTGFQSTVHYEGECLDKDFVLRFPLQKPQAARLWNELLPKNQHFPETAQRERALMAIFYANLKINEFENEPLGEFIFVVDRSIGERMNDARDTLALCLAALPRGTLFNIIACGSSFDVLFSSGMVYQSVEITNSTKNTALSYCSHLQADTQNSGVSLLEPLQAAFLSPSQADRPRQIFILTEGKTSNSREIKEYVSQQHIKTGARVFCFGIGSECSKKLLNGIAKAGGGQSEFIVASDSMQAKVMKQLKHALSPALTSIRVDWGSLKLSDNCTPARPPPLFHGNRMLSFAFCPEDCFVTPKKAAPDQQQHNAVHRTTSWLHRMEERKKAEEAGRLRLGNEDSRHSLPEAGVQIFLKTPDGEQADGLSLMKNCQETSGNLIHTFAAKYLLQDWEEAFDCESNEVEKKKLRSYGVELSKLFGIACSWTYFVGVEVREDETTGRMQLGEVNMGLMKRSKFQCCQARQGFGGAKGLASEQEALNPLSLEHASSSHGDPKRAASGIDLFSRMSFSTPAGMTFATPAVITRHSPQAPSLLNAAKPRIPGSGSLSPSQHTTVMGDVLTTLACLQNAYGSWNLNAQLATILGKPLDALETECIHAGVPEDVWATFLVLSYLHSTLGNRKEEWELCACKAQRWLQKVIGEEKAKALCQKFC